MESTSSNYRFARPWLLATVFLTGSAVMVIELLGTRIIAPFYGASLYVWSSLISVTMIALAVGYFVGGRWADRSRSGMLALCIALAGLFTLLIPWAARPVLLATDHLGLRAGAFVSALALFSPSLTFLGMVGPAAIKRGTSELAGLGNSAGSIYAMSTVGSVIGTLLLGFYLFPLVGSREILVGAGLGLLLLAIPIALYEHRLLKSSRALWPVACVALLGLLLLAPVIQAGKAYSGGDEFAIRSESESLYGWVRVIDQPKKNIRLLTSDASAIGAASISHGESLLTYQEIVGLIPGFRPDIHRVLIIGLGAGHMAKVLFDQYGIRSDTLEIDPAVARAATDYFGFQPTGRVIVGDARYEIRHLQGPYDLIIHDCFTGGSEPGHLLTVEALAELKGLLSEHGTLAVNFVAFASGPNSRALASVSRTLRQVLPQQALFKSEPGEDFTDFIFLAARQPIDFHGHRLDAGQAKWLDDRLMQVDENQGVVFTDNLNPLEHLQTAKSEHYRRFLVDMFGADLFVR